jgi:hypothetical protein
MITFHRVLIATAILFCASFSFWSLLNWLTSHDPVLLVLFVTFLAATGGLGYYLLHLRRFLRL